MVQQPSRGVAEPGRVHALAKAGRRPAGPQEAVAIAHAARCRSRPRLRIRQVRSGGAVRPRTAARPLPAGQQRSAAKRPE